MSGFLFFTFVEISCFNNSQNLSESLFLTSMSIFLEVLPNLIFEIPLSVIFFKSSSSISHKYAV